MFLQRLSDRNGQSLFTFLLISCRFLYDLTVISDYRIRYVICFFFRCNTDEFMRFPTVFSINSGGKIVLPFLVLPP